MRIPSVLAAIMVSCVACERAPEPVATAVTPASSSAAAPRLPSGTAGALVQRAIDAAGGWERWIAKRDVAFVTTFTVYNAMGDASSESIGVHKSPLHTTPRVRFESLGLAEPITLGFDGKEAWMLRAGLPVYEPARMVLPRFNMISNIFWFSLPFSLAELPMTVVDLGESGDDHHWLRLKVTMNADAPEAPGDWFILYLDPRDVLIDHILGHITASFLNHSLWLGQWLDYQDCDGIKKERRRQFFPADAEAAIVGNLVVDQLVEDVRFNNNFAEQLFRKPLKTSGGSST
ncbi:MAG TPA: hypothetical protein VMW17_03640 [Candidatus Binatia bacterium]|nr:hypothetical protein [Candidatus Binatia bacterium]